jgi:hypothetical protein
MVFFLFDKLDASSITFRKTEFRISVNIAPKSTRFTHVASMFSTYLGDRLKIDSTSVGGLLGGFCRWIA